ncbi:hypothetical protein MTO96_026491 [Rhipicephalus appendiculatus]
MYATTCPENVAGHPPHALPSIPGRGRGSRRSTWGVRSENTEKISSASLAKRRHVRRSAAEPVAGTPSRYIGRLQLAALE